MQALIFDCDGVLVDSEKLSCGAWPPVLARHGIGATLEEIEAFIGKSDRAVLEHFNRLNGTALDESVIGERLEQYYAMARGRLPSFPGLRETLLSLKERGTPVAVASSGSPEKIAFALREAGVEAFFGTVCSAVEVVRGKPAPDLFLLAANRLGVAPESCAVVEDSVFGIAAARAAGMTALGFTSSTSAAALREAGAARVFSAYAELLPLLGSLGG